MNEKERKMRRIAAGVLEAVKGFRRVKGHESMPQLVATLRARDQQLGPRPIFPAPLFVHAVPNVYTVEQFDPSAIS